MEHQSRDQHAIPRDPALTEAFEAFIQQTHVPRDFHARVRARVHQRRARRGCCGWRERCWAWWTHGWSPLWVCGAAVCGVLALALGIGLGHYVWTQGKPGLTAGPPGHGPTPTATADPSPITTAVVSPTPTAQGWHRTDVTVTLTAVAHAGGTGVQQIQWALAGASSGTHVVPRSRITATIAAEGATILTYGATDQAGHQEAPKTLTVKIDKTPPVITVAANPATLGPPTGKMIPFTLTGMIMDAGSGVNTSTATYTVTDESGSVHRTGSITVGVTGSYAFTIYLQALRSGDDSSNRQYTITVRAQDHTGNSGAQMVTLSSTAAIARLLSPGSTREEAVRSRSGVPSHPTPTPLPRSPERAIDVRSGPGAAYEVVATIAAVGRFVAVAQEQDWYKIQLPDGRQGWVHQTALQHEPPARTPSVVASMRGLLSPTEPPAAPILPPRALTPAVTALVIGNAAYPRGPLHNTVNDATDMAATLRRLGFDVTFVQDVPLQTMEEAVQAFHLRLRQGGIGLFYFAGHGLQVDGENYLLPLNARIERPQDVRYQALPLGRVVGAMEEAGNGLNILIVDACRNTPVRQSWRASPTGLAAPPTARGMLIAYATAPGRMAADGEGRNSVYTKHLLQAITIPGLSIEQVFKQVRSGVVAETGGHQTPWESSSLLGEVVLVPAPAAIGVTMAPSSSSSTTSSPSQGSLGSATPSREEVAPPAPSPSARAQRPPDPTAPHTVAATPSADAGSPPPLGSPSPARPAKSYMLIRRIYCEDIRSGVIQSSIDLTVTSYVSCAEAHKVLLELEHQRDNCRFPKDDSSFVDHTARESPHKAKEWVGTASCNSPS